MFDQILLERVAIMCIKMQSTENKKPDKLLRVMGACLCCLPMCLHLAPPRIALFTLARRFR